MPYNALTMTDETLLKKCVERDAAAWDEFVHRYRSLVLKSVRYKLGAMNMRLSSVEAGDIVQDIFLMIWEDNKLSRVRSADSLRGWLAIISINYTSNHCTRKIFKHESLTFSLDAAVENDAAENTFISRLSMPRSSIAETIEYNDLREIVDKELLNLSPKQRLALKLNLFDGQRHKEIAKIMRVPENTVTTLIRRGKERLTERLGSVLGYTPPGGLYEKK
jgi:RNA polymerase sigma-70 factor, ECF subfamily